MYLLHHLQKWLSFFRPAGSNKVQNMAAQLAAEISQAAEVVDALYSYLFRSKDPLAGDDGIDISGLCILLLCRIYESRIANVLMLL